MHLFNPTGYMSPNLRFGSSFSRDPTARHASYASALRRQRSKFSPPSTSSQQQPDKSSPKPPSLISIPRELRDMIWKAALGGRKISLTHRCVDWPWEGCGPPLWAAPYHYLIIRSVTHNSSNTGQEVTIQQHKVDNFENDLLIKKAQTTHLNLNLLQTSRQIYAEAQPFLFATNIFSFDDSKSFRVFVEKLNDQQRTQLKAISITFSGNCRRLSSTSDIHYWIRTISYFSSGMPALDTIGLDLKFFKVHSYGYSMFSCIVVDRHLLQLKKLMQERGIRLKKIPLHMNFHDKSGRWTEEQEARAREETMEERDSVLRSVDHASAGNEETEVDDTAVDNTVVNEANCELCGESRTSINTSDKDFQVLGLAKNKTDDEADQNTLDNLVAQFPGISLYTGIP